MRTAKFSGTWYKTAKKAVLCLFLILFQSLPCFASGLPPIITLGPFSQTVSEEGNVTFYVTVVSLTQLSYQWYFNNSPIAGATGSSLGLTGVTSKNAGGYYVNVVNAGGSVNSGTATLTVTLTPPVANNDSYTVAENVLRTVPASGVLANDTAPTGDSLTAVLVTNVSHGTLNLNSAGGFTYLPATNYYGTDSFTYRANDGETNSGVATVSLTITAPPVINTQPQSQGVAQGKNVSFSVVAGGGSPFSYHWYFAAQNGNTNSVPGGTNLTLTLNNVGSSNAGSYCVVVTNTYGSVTSAVATLAVYFLPGIQTQPQNQTVLQGGTAAFSIVTNNTGTLPFSYQWNVNGTNTSDGPYISGSTNFSLTLSNVQPAQAGNVFVVITNSAGSVTSQVATLTVNVPAFITNQPQPQTVLAGQAAALSVGAGGTPNLNYQWYFNGAKISGGQAATLSFSSAGTNNAGNYMVVLTNNYGSATSAVVALTVYVPPTITTQPQSQIFVKNSSNSFSVVAGGTAPLAYQWWFQGSALAGAVNSTLIISKVQNKDAGSYWVVVTNVAGSVTSAVAVLNVAIPPAVVALGASNVLTKSAALRGTVNPEGLASGYYFQFGTTTNYGFATITNTLAAGTNTSSPVLSVTDLSPGTVYHYCVTATNAAGTGSSADSIFTTAYLLPKATTLSATNLTMASASLKGRVNPEGSPASYYFQFGLTTNYDSFSLTNQLAAGTNAVTVTNLITGLTSATLYHYCLVAVNSGGTSNGADATFQTPYPPPVATTMGCSNVTAGTATLFGAINPQGTDTSYYFQYGTDTNYGSSSDISDAGDDTETQPVSMPIDSLSSGTTYYYNVVAVSSGGTTAATNCGTFTTLSVPPPQICSTMASQGINGRCMQLALTSVPGATFTVLSSTDATVPLSDWQAVGTMTEIAPGVYQFTDPQPATNPSCYYSIQPQ